MEFPGGTMRLILDFTYLYFLPPKQVKPSRESKIKGTRFVS